MENSKKQTEETSESLAPPPTCNGVAKPTSPPEGGGTGRWACGTDGWYWIAEVGG